MSVSVREWFAHRSFSHQEFAGLAAAGAGGRRELSTTLIFPTRNVAATIGPILATVARLNQRSWLVDQVIVVDADSPDGTADIARSFGAEVYSENELLPGYGPARGKGDAMWRSLSVARGDIVMFADADTTNFGEHFIYGTLGPLLTRPEVRFSKAAYRRPFTDFSQSVIDGGGRVTELMAKPLFNFCCPELTGFVQPLAGEFAAYRELFCGIPFLTGYGVELGILVDVLQDAGLAAMAQVDLGARQNRHQPLWDLSRMSSAVLRAMASRVPVAQRGMSSPAASGVLALRRAEVYLHAVATETGLRLDEHASELLERPPMAQLLSATSAASAMMVNAAPCGSVRMARRPGGASAGGTVTCPHSSVARAAAASQSVTAK
jgi:glucosyl-3-phosphoglycerate synthase